MPAQPHCAGRPALLSLQCVVADVPPLMPEFVVSVKAPGGGKGKRKAPPAKPAVPAAKPPPPAGPKHDLRAVLQAKKPDLRGTINATRSGEGAALDARQILQRKRHKPDAGGDGGVRADSSSARVAELERQVERLTEEKERALEVSAANAARVATLEQEVGSMCPRRPAPLRSGFGLLPSPNLPDGLMRDGVRQLEDTRADAAKQRSDSTQLAEYQASCKSLKRDLVPPPPPQLVPS